VLAVESGDFQQLGSISHKVCALVESVEFQNIQRSSVAGRALRKVKTLNSYGAVLSRSCAHFNFGLL
jgi:hypothetical protein